ncbi:hypothetical protein GS438_13690 [Rhodococcus hoagii]|nr:hypothetical protein [Prescottella equi]
MNSSAPAQTVTVNAPTTTTLQVPASATTGAPVTLSASVTPSNAAGTVQFKDNGTAIGSPVAVAAGQASVQHTFGAAGSHSITAEFSGGPDSLPPLPLRRPCRCRSGCGDVAVGVCSWFRDDRCVGGPGGDGESVDC